jgi:hypothetical protein
MAGLCSLGLSPAGTEAADPGARCLWAHARSARLRAAIACPGTPKAPHCATGCPSRPPSRSPSRWQSPDAGPAKRGPGCPGAHAAQRFRHQPCPLQRTTRGAPPTAGTLSPGGHGQGRCRERQHRGTNALRDRALRARAPRRQLGRRRRTGPCPTLERRALYPARQALGRPACHHRGRSARGLLRRPVR